MRLSMSLKTVVSQVRFRPSPLLFMPLVRCVRRSGRTRGETSFCGTLEHKLKEAMVARPIQVAPGESQDPARVARYRS
jgi:hypothetical protein